MNTINWAMALDLGVGIGVFLAGLGILVVLVRLGHLFARLEKTLDEMDRQIATISVPVTDTLGHVEGIAGTADVTIAKLATVVGKLEVVASGVAKTSDLAQHAVGPTLINLAATLNGVSAGLRKLVGAGNGAASHAERE